jgi:pyrroline-5-carboxylate reductase
MNAPSMAVIGGGNMAEAILRGALRAGRLHGEFITVAEPRPERRYELNCALGVRVTESNIDALAGARIVLLAVKPQIVDQVMAEIGPLLSADQLLVSVAAGVTIQRLSRFCPHGPGIIRTMPNTPMLAGRGVVGLSRGPAVNDADAELVRQILGAVALCLELPEEKLDAVTAISGSGPAYFFLLVESLAEAGCQLGLTRQEAEKLSRETFIGAARLMDQDDTDAAELRRRVTSPGGTTAAAIDEFTRGGFGELVARAANAACRRSRELGQGK